MTCETTNWRVTKGAVSALVVTRFVAGVYRVQSGGTVAEFGDDWTQRKTALQRDGWRVRIEP